MNKYFQLALILLLAPIYARGTDELCRNRTRPAHEHSDLIQAAVLVGKEDRETAESFSESSATPMEQVQKAFAASGLIDCGGIEITAQITGKNNVITTAGHIFQNEDCSQLSNAQLEQCFFRQSGDPSEKQYKIDVSSLKTGTCVPGGHFEDWGVVKLLETVDGVEPYRVPSKSVRFQPNTTILSVSSYDMNFNGAAKNSVNIQTCAIKQVMPSPQAALTSDCDIGAGASGSAQFTLDSNGISLDPDKLVLSAINVAESLMGSEGAEFSNTNFNVSVPVSGKFLDAIKANMQ